MSSSRIEVLIALLIFLASGIGACGTLPASAPPSGVAVTTVDQSALVCGIHVGRGWNRGGCRYAWGEGIIITNGVPMGYPVQGGSFVGFPPSIEQRLGVAPNECFVDVPGGVQQVACVLNRTVKRYFDAPGGRAVVFNN